MRPSTDFSMSQKQKAAEADLNNCLVKDRLFLFTYLTIPERYS